MPEDFRAPGDTRSLLRQATKQAHGRLHDHQGLGALTAGKLDTAGYVKLLLKLLPLHRLVEERLSAFTEKPCLVWRKSFDRIECSDQLCADLRFLGVSSVDVPDLGRLLKPFETQAEALGCAWVIEGSALGSRVLSRSLANSLGIGADNGGAFFAPQPKQNERWLACCSAIEKYGQYPQQRSDMIASAQATFAAFLLWMNGTS